MSSASEPSGLANLASPIPVDENLTVEEFLKAVSAFHEQEIQSYAESLCQKLRKTRDQLAKQHGFVTSSSADTEATQ